ncbi:hypothetical protein Lser_V15G24868 [Lactuca serriola]
MGGLKYAYFCCSGPKLSKLDRFLACANFIKHHPSLAATALPRELFDHSPITLISSVVDFGPSPFKFFNSWLLVEGINEVVTTAWSEFKGYGTADMQLMARLRHVKYVVRNLRNMKFKEENKELIDLKEEKARMELVAESRPLSDDELKALCNGAQRILELEKLKSLDLRQKARIRWTIDGDENSKFFHGVINSKNKRNRIQGLSINGRWTTDVNRNKD